MQEQVCKCDICHLEYNKNELKNIGDLTVCSGCKDEIRNCYWCKCKQSKDDLIRTTKGYLCEQCENYLISCGYKIVVIYNDN